ncbi:hypothetical protein E2320_008168, partial [Naja naja]
WKKLKTRFTFGSQLSLRRLKILKTCFTFGSELSLRNYPKSYLKIVGRPIQPENATFDAEIGFQKELQFHVPQSGKH